MMTSRRICHGIRSKALKIGGKGMEEKKRRRKGWW